MNYNDDFSLYPDFDVTHDRYGNRNFVTGTGKTTTLVNCTTMCNPAFSSTTNRITSSGYTFDASGNTTADPLSRTFVYDGENKQTTVSNGSGTIGTYLYDGNGKRVKKTSATGDTLFFYDAAGRLVEEANTSASNCSNQSSEEECETPLPVTTSYIYAGSRLLSTETNGTTTYLTADHLGSPRINTDGSGNVAARHDYLPFGEEIFPALTTQRTSGVGYVGDGFRKQFTGYELDNESNLDYAGARFYNSQHGRFTSPDDFLNDTSVSDPKSWNLYVYVRNNPLNYVDPFGEEVYSANLSDEEKKKLLDDWRNNTGYKNIYFDKDNKLVIDTKAGFDGGSKSARQLLSDAVDSTEKRFNLTSVDSKDVAFAQVDAGTITQDSSGKKVGPTVFQVNLDFKDFNQFRGSDKDAVAAFSIGIAAFHEIAHKLYKEIGDSPNSDTDPGPVENTYINPIRRELGLAERVYYSAKPVPATLKSFFPNGGNQLQFRLNKKDKILRWQSDQVGGKVQ